ncbi:MAG TPA: hypothetical protein VGX91_13600 [Candidatus Cybelea sp.]|jgi:hypothetical protein|nr:hypothetical protein [Candidatus Cybelea sp.]
MAGPTLKGALISFMPSSGIGVPSSPNVIVFQINPETITHAWTEAAAAPAPTDSKVHVNPLAVTGAPGESFSFTLMLDSDEQIADTNSDPVGAALALGSGVYSRLAALELLQFPTPLPDQALTGQVSAATSAAAAGTSVSASSQQQVPTSQVPIVLFVWGALRVVPVRVTAFTVSEKLFDGALNPTHVEAQITINVLTPDELAAVQGPMQGIANTAYTYTQGVRQAQATLNLTDSSSAALGILPTPF